MIPQKNRFSDVDDWDEPEEEVYRVYSKEEIAALQKSDASKYRALSPWKIVLAQIVITALSMVFWSIFGAPVGVSLYTQSAFLGGLISVLPTALFLTRLELAKKSQRLNPGRFLAALVSGEFIKIAVTLMMFIGIAFLVPGVLWVPLLVTYLLALKCVWLAWFWR
ncbi:ATP synthase subunit I [Polynucleobacter asymbioticus]|uniref:Putative ATP synthase protein I AtpI n=1 Tax=Polynucleobacter asymbioticus (strain DSM 18221 / CIP 109841 / QLW-P1DMWA-1) TaxID=312153 RepID=A4SUS7_POLAQ|nr:ATP synthase subunit I [Polynucleobacter asymbioticus]ABP33241.1 putative ATP synthase protein I AtpI [Polynucleobacter asymbioticus QLW-P1DMWA-1]